MGLPQIYEGSPISVPKFHFIVLSGISPPTGCVCVFKLCNKLEFNSKNSAVSAI